MRRLDVDGRRLDDASDCYVIAELGHNHQGSLHLAKEMILSAKEAGADAVKLQKRDNRALFTRAMYESPYARETSFGGTYGEHRESLELGADDLRALQALARDVGITLFATAFDAPSASLLAELDQPAFKIASGDLRNLPLLRQVAAFQKPIFLSTGAASLSEVSTAVDVVTAINDQLCLLQCTASYPCHEDELNLRVIATYRERFPNLVIGLSAHDAGTAHSLVAYALGARVIEKHFTLSRSMKGTDHAFSLEPPELRRLVTDLRSARKALGDGVKVRYRSEDGALEKMGKRVVAARSLPAGHALTAADLTVKSPGGDAELIDLDRLIGRVTSRPIQEDERVVDESLRHR